jgi:TRAP-type C4-dicarboxylate transport system permease small subunit
MEKLSAVFGRLFEALAKLAALLLLAMVAVVTGDIVLRNVLRGGIAWSNEVSEYALYFITLLTAPWLLRKGQHVRVDLVLTLVPARLARAMEVVADIAGLVVCAVLVRTGLLMAHDSWRLGAITIKNLVFPEWWLLAPLPVAFALLAIEFAFRFHRLLGTPAGPRRDATSVG